MKLFLRIKHWQLILLMMLPSILIQLIIPMENIKLFKLCFVVIMLLFIVVFLGWLYSISINLYEKLPKSVKINLTKLKLSIIIPTLDIVFFMLIFVLEAQQYKYGYKLSKTSLFPFFFIFHFFAVFCILYILNIIAKEIKAVELQKPVKYIDFGNYFLLLWFFPIGIWVVQPKINKIFKN